MSGPHTQAANAVETDEQGRELHDKLFKLRAERHDTMTPGEREDVNQAIHDLELMDDGLVKRRRNWERAQQRAGERELRNEDRAGERNQRPRANGRPRGQQRRQRPAVRRRSPARAFGYGFLAGRAHPYVEQTGLPGTTRGTTSLVLGALGGAIGLSVVYDVLVYNRAPLLFLQGISGLVTRIVRPVDPLGPGLGDFSAAELRAKHVAANKPVNPKLNPRAAGPPDPRKGGYLPGGPLPNLTNQLLTGVNG